MPESPESLELIEATRDFAVVRKPYGWLSEKNAAGHAPGCNVPDALESCLSRSRLPFEGIFCVHRLDRTTEGLMLYALTQSAAAELSAVIRNGGLAKIYHAYLTPDDALPPSGELRDFLYFDRRADKSFVVSPGKKEAKEAALSYRFLDSVSLRDAFGDAFEARKTEVRLETGRSHQIRVQFGSRKSPLVGDGKYGSRVKYHGPALFSVRLSFLWHGRETVFEREETLR